MLFATMWTDPRLAAENVSNVLCKADVISVDDKNLQLKWKNIPIYLVE